MHTKPVTSPQGKPLTTVQRWLALIDRHGSQNAALVALFRRLDELERLEGAVRACGLSPELLASEIRKEQPYEYDR